MQSNHSSFTMMEVPHHYQFRIIVIGDTMVGKSSLLKTFAEGVFSDSEPTVGVDFFSKIIKIRNPHLNLQGNSQPRDISSKSGSSNQRGVPKRSPYSLYSSSPKLVPSPKVPSKQSQTKQNNKQSGSGTKVKSSDKGRMNHNSSLTSISTANSITNQDNIIIKLQIWDTAGQERFRSIVTSYYRNSVGIILVYDITNRESYDHLVDWLFEARRFVESPSASMNSSAATPSKLSSQPMTPIETTLGSNNAEQQGETSNGNQRQQQHQNENQKHQQGRSNKSKIVYLVIGCKTDLEAQRQVSYEDGQAFANLYGLQFIETSSKARHNVDQAFQILSEEIYDRISDSGRITIGNETIALDSTSQVPIDGVRLGPLVAEANTSRSGFVGLGGNRSRILEAEPVSGFMGGCC